MNENYEIENLCKKITELGSKVDARHTTTKFPEWCLLKIGLNAIQGLPFEKEYYEGLLEPKVINSSSSLVE